MEINKEKILKNINSIIAVLAIIMWFLPMFRLKAYEIGYSNAPTASGFAVFTGMEFSDGSETGMNLSSGFLFLCPLMLVLSNYVKKLEKLKRYSIFVAPVGGVLFLFLTKLSVQGSLNMSVGASIGFWLYLLLNVLLLILAYFQFKSIELDKEQIQKIVEGASAKFEDASQSLLGATCPGCGNKVMKGKKFCSKCGAKLPEESVSSNKMTCSGCGKTVSKSSKFCPNCGKTIAEETKKEDEGK